MKDDKTDKTVSTLDMNDKDFIKWRRKSEYKKKNGISYWVIDGDFFTNEEMFNQYVRIHKK